MTARTAVASGLEDYDETAARKLRGCLAEKRISKHGLAVLLGQTDFWVGRRANGQTAITIGELAMIAEALGEPIARFLPESADKLRPGARSSTDRASDYGSQRGQFRRPPRRRRHDRREMSFEPLYLVADNPLADDRRASA